MNPDNLWNTLNMGAITNKDYFDKVWGNIQHNENIRNRLFQFYLGITGVFIVFFKEFKEGEINGEQVLLSAFFIWLIGLAFLWAYVRIIEMISRDNKIIMHFHSFLAEGDKVDKKIYNEYDIYNVSIATTSLKWWSISSCITTTTSLISAIILSSGICYSNNFNWQWLVLLIILIVILNKRLIVGMNNIAEKKVKNIWQYGEYLREKYFLHLKINSIEIKKGILKTLMFYGIGFGTSGIISLIVKQTYIHGLGLQHLIMFMTLLIGVIWTLISLIRFFNKPTNILKGIIITNALILFIILIYLNCIETCGNN